MYHEDHFCGKLTNKMAPLVNNRSYAITGTRTVPATDDAPETAVVSVEVVGPHAPDTFAYDFHLRRKRVGPRKGSWTTWMLLPASGA